MKKSFLLRSLSSFFKHLPQTPSIIQIVFFNLLMSWTLGSLTQLIWALADPRAWGNHSIPQGAIAWIGKFIWCGIGIAIFIWNLWEIFKPGIAKQRFIPLTRVPLGSLSIGIPNSMFKTNYLFVSSHPSYLVLDSIIIFFYWFLSWLGEVPLSLYADLGRNLAIGCWIGASIPILRIIAWYGLRIRPVTWDSTTQKLVKEAWKPAVLFSSFFYLVMGIIFILGFKAGNDEAQRIQSLPILDTTLVQDHNFFEKILAPLEKNQLERHSIQMRLRGTQIWTEPLQCENNQHIQYGTLLTQLGAETEVFIVANGYAYGGLKELLAKSKNNQGKIVEFIGTLKRIPRDWQYKYTEWKVYCGLKDLPEPPHNGRWIFEVKGLER